LQLNEPSCTEIFGDIDLNALQTSFNQLLQRHEVLRCGFKQVNGEITCFLDPACTVVPMTVHQVSCFRFYFCYFIHYEVPSGEEFPIN